MAHKIERWEQADDQRHQEEEVTAVEARQGMTGRRILTILVVALVLAFVVWIPVEIWGSRKADTVTSQQPGQALQNEQSVSPAKPSVENGTAVPTETPNTQQGSTNVQPATPSTTNP